MIISQENKIAELFSGKHLRRLFVMNLNGTLLCSDDVGTKSLKQPDA